MVADVPYREVSLPAGIKQGVKLAAETGTVCAHKWVKAKGLDCQICKLCGAYSALSVLKIPIWGDAALAEEMILAADQPALKIRPSENNKTNRPRR